MSTVWKTNKLTDISTVQTGKHDANHSDVNGKYTFFTCAYMPLRCNTKRFEGKCLVLPGNGANVGEVFYYDGEFDAYQRTYVISEIKVNERYLYYYMKYSWRDINLNKQYGSATNFLKIGNFKDYEVSYPSSEEQKEIVEILDQAFESIDKAKANIEQNIENAKELLLSQREIFFDKLSFDKSSQIKPLNDLCLKIFAGGDKPKDFSKIKTLKQNIPVIANAVKNNGIYGYTETPVVKGNSVTVAARGSGTGHVEFRDYDYFPVVRLIVLIPDNDLINEKFLMTSIKNLKVRSSGSAIPQLTVPMIKTYSIAVPNLEKQKEIVETLDIIDNHIQSLLTSYEEELKNLEELKKSILQKAFSGELTNKNKAA